MEDASAILPDGKPKERIGSLCYRELTLLTGVSLSYRRGLKLLNRLLRRSGKREMKFRTYLDFCQRVGKRAEESAAQEAESRLRRHGFDPESGKPCSPEELPPDLREGARKEENAETVAGAIARINAGRQEEDERVRAGQSETENPKDTVYISVDEVGVRHQKEHRTPENQKSGAFVWNTNALVQSREGKRIFTCVGMKKTFLFVLAYLLDKGMLKNRSLVFFIDGAGNLLSNISKMFSFHSYRVILDWYHLKKRCQEYLSMSFRRKGDKESVLRKLLRILWAGNVTEGVLYLRNLNPGLFRAKHRVHDLTGYLEKHREHIPCYALRAELGLRNSSNDVEKENDLIVAQRQKHNGMSWSTTGSGALAQIAALSINGELGDWLRANDLSAISSCSA